MVFIRQSLPNKIVRPNKHAVAYLFSIGMVAIMQALIIWAPVVGVYATSITLAALMGLAIFKEKFRHLAISLAIIPVAVLVCASFLPNSNLGSTVLFQVTLLVLAAIYRFMFAIDEPVKVSKLSFSGYAVAIPFMAVVGLLLGGTGYLLLHKHYQFLSYPLPIIAVIVVVLAMCEEIFMRGLVQQQAAKLFGPSLVIAGMTVLYALLSLEKDNWLSIPMALLTGLTLSYIYHRKQNVILTFTVSAMSKLIYIILISKLVLR